MAVVLVAWTGYRGGQLSLGADHLTEHMPKGLRHVLGVTRNDTVSSKADPNTFYGARVQPIFAARCVSCHGPDKHKANLRLDRYQGVIRGGKDGPVVQAGNAQGSDLFRRVTLPANHDDFMPKGGKKALTSDEVKLIELWIAAGASETLAKDAIKNAPADSAVPAVAEVTFQEIDPVAVTRVRAAIAPAVAQLQKRFPNILDYESRGSADLRLNASIIGTRFGDNDLAELMAVAEHITVADFSRTGITDRSANTIAAMKRLRVLRLTNTGITDATLVRLGGLVQLESLNLFGTSVTPAALPTISKLPKLAHLYAGQTSIPQTTPVPEALSGKIVF
jgi:mono/diheme cytochrome c family protein